MNFDHSHFKLPPSIPTNLQTSVFPSFSSSLPFFPQEIPRPPIRNKLECPCCHKVFKRKDHLQRHFHTLHQDHKQISRCETCGKEFTREDNYKIHLKTHNKEKPFQCEKENCQKNFKNKAALDFHRLSHEGQKISCNFPGCNKKFLRPNELKRHKKARKFHLRMFFQNYKQKKKLKCDLMKFKDVVSEIFTLKEKLINFSQ